MGRHRNRSWTPDHDRKRRRSRSRDKRRHSSSSEEERETKRRNKRVFYNFERYKSKLVSIFFRPEDFVSHGSKEYSDFWKFLRKYQAFERKKAEEGGDTKHQKESSRTLNELGIPSSYDKQHNLTFRLKPDDPKDLLNRIPFQDWDDEASVLTEVMVTEFQYILSLYIDFLQREKFTKLRKLREAQANLPIAEYRNEILDQLSKNQVVIVAGDTGCGKSTQVPQYLLQAGYQNIACTQPRRIACISLAKRVGYETLNEFGSEIGYQIRFERRRTEKTRVLFLTEGLLLRQVSADSSLSGYDVIVLDEVHERHLHGDFLLGVVKCLAHQRPDVKCILMSATINIKLFQDYFNGEAPVVQVPGRLYPIKLQYHPIPSIEQSSNTEKLNPAPYVRILQLIDKKYPDSERGDVLIFLSGLREITTIVDACREFAEKENKWIILPLHSTLSLADQDKVFDYPPEGVRKCIVSTNIAETSITIDGVRFVVDSGKVKEMQYDPTCKMQRLKEFWISRASAEQRKGRAGRTGPGVCFRMYADAEYKALSPYSTPEIQRVPLDNLILQMVSMGLPDARKFPFIEPPPAESLENSIMVLKEQGALEEDESLSITGKMLSNLPVDVSIGKMLIMGTLFHQMESVLSLAAAMSVQSPFTNKAYQDTDCVAARKNLDSDHGDPITLLNSFREWLLVKSDNRENSRKWCKKRGLEEQRFYEMMKLRAQFKEILEQSGLLKKESDAMADMSSSERAARHGEIKQLRNMKREYHKQEGPKKKKVLKVRHVDAGEDEAADEGVDIKDIEFRLKNDGKQLRELLAGTKAYSYKDLMLLKLILTSGLYPQLAVADEFNQSKGGMEQLFHTKSKPFNVLHPNSIFAAHPEVLTVDELDIVKSAGDGKHPMSAKHQLLVYLSLLETNKPYVMNIFRMPALTTLLLFSHHIDTNGLFTRMVFDSWLELKFLDAEQAQNALLAAANMRALWQELLTIRLQETLDSVEASPNEERENLLERKLSQGLVDLLHKETPYSIRRLLPGDLKVLYRGAGFASSLEVEENPLKTYPKFTAAPNATKGGWNLSEYLVYNCLENQGDELEGVLCMQWSCPFCELDSYSGPLRRMTHYAECSEKEDDKKDAEEIVRLKNEANERNPLAREYFCEKCDRSFRFTTTEILRHKKSH